MTTKRRGRYFPTSDTQELETALQAFRDAQKDYEEFEQTYTAALYRGERPNRMRLAKLESDYHRAAIFAANVALDQRRDVANVETPQTAVFSPNNGNPESAAS